MNVNLNLAVPPKLRERYAFAVSAPTVVIGLIILGVLIHVGLGEYAVYKSLRKRNADPEHREARLRQAESDLKTDLSRSEVRGTLLEAQFVNQLIDRRRFSISDLALTAGELLPLDARLTGLGLLQSEGSPYVRFQVAAKTTEALENFVSNLENSPQFADPVVASQGFERGQAAQAGEVNVTCTARYLEDKTNEGEADREDEPSSRSIPVTRIAPRPKQTGNRQ